MTNQAKPCGCTHTDIVLLENNKLANITKKSNVICHGIKEYVKS